MTEPRPAHRIVTSRADFVDALRAGFAAAADAGCRELWIADPDFADWPIGEIAVVEQLTRWALPHRRLTVVACGYDEVVRRHPRFVAWRRQWSHVVDCRQFDDDGDADALPTLLLAPGVVTVRLFDRQHLRASVSADPADALQARELLDEVAQRSVEAFPATTLGL